MKEAFDNYTKNYDMNDSDIDYKYNHSYWVMALSKFLAKKLNLDEKDVELATIIGLYHDIGRFEEDKIFNSFGVHKNFDHGDYGRDVLLKEGIIKQIPIEEKYHSLIVKAVEMHNKYEIEPNLDKKTLMHCKIVRDADKLDIIRSASKGMLAMRVLNEKVSAEEISDSVKKEFYNNVQIRKRKKSIHSSANAIISLWALIYDINYKESLEYLIKNNIVNNLYQRIKDKKGYKEYFDHINDYLKRRMEDVR